MYFEMEAATSKRYVFTINQVRVRYAGDLLYSRGSTFRRQPHSRLHNQFEFSVADCWRIMPPLIIRKWGCHCRHQPAEGLGSVIYNYEYSLFRFFLTLAMSVLLVLQEPMQRLGVIECARSLERRNLRNMPMQCTRLLLLCKDFIWQIVT